MPKKRVPARRDSVPSKSKKKPPKKKAQKKVSPPKKKGRPRKFSTEEAAAKQREAKAQYQRNLRLKANDIAPIPYENIDWERRNACRRNLQLFQDTYLKDIFALRRSEDQIDCCNRIEDVMLEGGKFCLAMPRGGGKTANCRGGIIWGTAYGHRRFPFFVASTDEQAGATLETMRIQWYTNPLLLQDFPEIAYPVVRLENRPQSALSQTCDGISTHIQWGKDGIKYPCILLPKEIAEIYINNGEKLIYIEHLDRWITRSAGTRIGISGIMGSIRGEAGTHPITLEQPRPDLVLLDDVQKDQNAESPAARAKIIRLVDGAVTGLAGPGRHIAALMPCTVICEGDVADTFLDPLLRPDWQGKRCQMVTSWPDGLTDFEISYDTIPGKLWNDYSELRKKSLRLHGDHSLATKMYVEHREDMDKDFVCSWQDRYEREGKLVEISPQQHAMNLRLQSPEAFASEFQNVGRRLIEEGEVLITSDQLQKKTTALQRNEIPLDAEHVTCFVDVQNEVFFWTIFACAPDFTGTFVNYGIFPDRRLHYFTKGQTEGWGMLTSLFFKEYPQLRDQAKKTKGGRIRAPFEAKIYHGLTELFKYLDGIKLYKSWTNERVEPISIDRFAIDTRWGVAADAIKRFIIQSGRRKSVIPYYGQGLPPTNLQYEEYQTTKGWLFEHQINPQVKETKWYVKPGTADGLMHMLVDVNRMKDFLFARLGSPVGTPGTITLFDAPPEDHELFCDHICKSEYPEPVTARMITKNMWTLREARPDNDFLDCSVGCLAIASRLGAAIKPGLEKTPSGGGKKRITDRWKKTG